MQFLFVEQMYDRYPREHSVPSLHTKIKIQGDSMKKLIVEQMIVRYRWTKFQ